eukprot:266076_1
MQNQLISPNVQSEIKLAQNPGFSLNDIRKIIPSHLFEKSYLKSFYWLFHDCLLVAVIIYLGTFITEDKIPFIPLRLVLNFIYWYTQGAFMTGLWIIAHECGHHSFSPNKLLNNIVGFTLHTMLLVPYFSWQYTHSTHHS